MGERREVIAPPIAEKPSRLDSLTGLRWWAAFAVFGHHMANLAPLPLLERPLSYGAYGVTFFFVLSGFVLTWSARPGVTPTTFWLRRFARIYPSHLVALFLAIPVFYSFAPVESQWWVKPVDVGILLLSVVLLQGWSRDPTILFSGNPAAWTLSCEAFFYALHPFIHRVFGPLKTRGALLVTGGIIVLAFTYRVLVILYPGAWFAQLPWPIIRLSEFVVGIGLARAILSGWRVPIKPIYCYLVAGAFIAWLSVSPRWAADNPFVQFILSSANEWIIVLCAVTIAAVGWRDVQRGFSILRSRVLVRLGEWSYAFYLVHATIIYAVLALVGPQAPSWRNVLWYAGLLVLSLVVAALLHYLVERPCERALRNWWSARLAQKAGQALAKASPSSP